MDGSTIGGGALPISANESAGAEAKECKEVKRTGAHTYKEAAIKQGVNFFSGFVCAGCGRLAGEPKLLFRYDQPQV